MLERLEGIQIRDETVVRCAETAKVSTRQSFSRRSIES